MTDCGAACLATISKQNGYRIGITKIREVAGTDKQGTNVYGVIKAAEQLGFSAKGVKGDREAFFSEFPLPCIAHVIVDGNLLHYVVIHKITKKQVVIADPGVGIVKLSPEAFFGEVHEEGKPPKYQWSGILILLVKTETFQKGDETKGLFERFLYLLKPQKKLLLHIFIASLVYTILGILGAFYFKVMIDSILPDGLRKTLMTISIGVILLNLFKVLLNAFRSHLLLYLSQKLDIAKIAEAQAVKFEIAAYPSEEYGYFTGRIDSIAKDITVDQSSGSAYYMVKVKCDSVTVQNKEGKTGTVMNGMACQAKVVVEEENVLHYLLKKIDLID